MPSIFLTSNFFPFFGGYKSQENSQENDKCTFFWILINAKLFTQVKVE
jgi:hypothetical protein